ncbi:MAG TPA: single-stranded DNA-binding protein [Gemmatimonadota bacterium]|nr:single-stranded DNA-binding protein [Gemmatimonadota bacterium]
MSRSLNKAMIIGNLGADPEIRSTQSGTRVATLSVATSRSWTDRSGQTQEKTEWHRVVAWDKLAEICERYLSKGDRVYVEGRIEYRQWEGQDGQTRYTTEIRAREMIMLGGRGDGGRGTRGPGPGAAEEGDDDEDYSDFSSEALMGEDDLPF